MKALLAKKRTSYQHNMLGEWPEDEEEVGSIIEDHKIHQRSLEQVRGVLDSSPFSYSEVFVPDTDKFADQDIETENDLVVSVGGDGTALSSIDHALDSALLPVKSSPNSRGVLCNDLEEFEEVLEGLEKGENPDSYALVEVEYRGETIRGLNDVFIGPETGRTASYNIELGKYNEEHQSSGLLFATGRGSTGWYDSIMSDRYGELENPGWGFDERNLGYAVRELSTAPDESRSDYMPIDGSIPDNLEVEVQSKMNVPGKIIVDGRNSKTYSFPRGEKVTIRVSDENLRMV